MPSFRAIFLVAATAFAALTAAAPGVPAPAVHRPDVHEHRPDVHVHKPAVHEHRPHVQEPAVHRPDAHELGKRCGCSTVPDLFTHVQVNIDTITNKCHEATSGGAIDINVAVDLLVQIKAIVSAAINDVNAIADLHVGLDAILLSGGSLIDIKACASLVANVVIAVVGCLDILVKACLSLKVDVSAVLSLVAEIGGLICTLLKLVFALVAGIEVIVCGLVKVVATVLVGLKLNVVVNVLGLTL